MVASGELISLRGKRVLVTGAAGFIGRFVCERLVGHGAATVGVSRRTRDSVADTPALRQIDWARVDLADRAGVQRLIDDVRPHVIIHLAGRVGGSRDRSLVEAMLQANLLNTVTLLDAAADSGCCEAFVQAGSLEEPDHRDEAPCSPYAAAKSAATSYTLLYARHYGLNCSVARISMVYGPGKQDPDKLVPYVIRNGLRGESIRLSSGHHLADWVYVEDVADGLLRLAREPGFAGRSIDIGTGQLDSVRHVVTRLWALLGLDGRPPFGTAPDRDDETTRAADVARTDHAIGFRPTMGLDSGLAATVEWFRDEYARQVPRAVLGHGRGGDEDE